MIIYVGLSFFLYYFIKLYYSFLSFPFFFFSLCTLLWCGDIVCCFISKCHWRAIACNDSFTFFASLLSLFYFSIFLFFYYWLLLMMDGARSLIHVLILVITFYFYFKLKLNFNLSLLFLLYKQCMSLLLSLSFSTSRYLVSYYHLSSPLSSYCPPRKACIL